MRGREAPLAVLGRRALQRRVQGQHGQVVAGQRVDDDRRKKLRPNPDDALARADDDEAADGLTRAHDLEAVAEGEKRGAYGYN